MQLKTSKEIKEVIDNFKSNKRATLKALVYSYIETEDMDMLYTIDDEFLYEHRWEFFEHLTDSELLYETVDVEDFVDKVYGIYYAEDKVDTKTMDFFVAPPWLFV